MDHWFSYTSSIDPTNDLTSNPTRDILVGPLSDDPTNDPTDLKDIGPLFEPRPIKEGKNCEDEVHGYYGGYGDEIASSWRCLLVVSFIFN